MAVTNVSNLGKTLDDVTTPVSQRATSPNLTQNDFLKIMIEQIKSQNPLDSGSGDQTQFFQQMVQFQTLEAMQSMQKAIKTLSEVSGLAQASGLIGRQVTALVPTTKDPKTGFPRPDEVVSGTVARVTFASEGTVVHLSNGRQVPADRVKAIS